MYSFRFLPGTNLGDVWHSYYKDTYLGVYRTFEVAKFYAPLRRAELGL
jgi:hypothetical protein